MQAERGDSVLYTSFFAFAEVFKAKCEGPAKPLAEAQDRQIEAMLRQPWVRAVLVDERIGTAARRLMRQHPECKKPSDAIHLATALALDVDEMHTFDGNDLLGLNEKVMRADGVPLKICTAYVPIAPPSIPIPTIVEAAKQGMLQLETPTEIDQPSDIIEWVTEVDFET
jgi:predicted nucleic acid-binding protein